MGLDVKQIQQILQRPLNTGLIHKAVELQQRIRFHTETNMSACDNQRPANVFIGWVKSLLPSDKFNIFLQLFKFPLPSIAIVENVYQELERIFYSRNSSFLYQFSNTELATDWADYKRNVLNEPLIWKSVGWKKMQIAPNSIVVVDLPKEQKQSKPEPYFYWLDIDQVIDYQVNENDNNIFDWLIFRQPDNQIAVFDDTYIRVYQLDDKNSIKKEISSSLHGLNYCPARFFWSTSVSDDCKDLKKNPIVKELANLDWYLFFALSKRHLDLYAPYPIYSMYESDCHFENSDTHEYCDGGYLRNENGDYVLLNDGSIKECPICCRKRVAGPGSFLEVPVPSDGVDMRNPVQITTIDRESLEYNVDECTRLKNEIIVSIIGRGNTVTEKEAINELQVVANFESKTAVLNALKTNFELIQTFVDDTICKMRYGDSFISSSINWGSEFYVYTVAELYEKLKMAKDNGASDFELDAISQQILEVEYRNNPLMLQRMLILRELEPYPNKTLNELITLYNQKLLDNTTLQLKLNFNTLINRFERENIDIIEFASNKPMREKISKIKDTLIKYLDEIRVPDTKKIGFENINN